MNVFQALIHLEAPLLYLFAHLEQARHDLLGVCRRDDPLRRQHPGVRDRASDVLQRDAPV